MLTDIDLATGFIIVLSLLLVWSQIEWRRAESARRATLKELTAERETSERWFQQADRHAKRRMAADAENAALRSQINQRGAGGKFVPRQPK